MKVATFNLHHCEGPDGAIDVERVAGVVSALSAEVVALQEIDRGLPRSGRVDQAAEIERVSGLHLFFYATVRRAGGEYGIAIAARDPLHPEVVDLPGSPDVEPRVALAVEMPTGVTVVATHLSRMKQRDIQERQLETLAGIVSSRSGPVILLGDLNRGLDDLGALIGAGLRAAVSAPTFPAQRPRHQLDHILVSEPLRVTDCGVVAAEASDHLPAWARLDIQGDVGGVTGVTSVKF